MSQEGQGSKGGGGGKADKLERIKRSMISITRKEGARGKEDKVSIPT